MDRACHVKARVCPSHSRGGNIAAYYAAHYPADLAGVLLIDPGTWQDMKEDFKGSEADARNIRACGWKCTAAAVAARVGLVRLAARKAGSINFTNDENARYGAGLAHARTMRTVMGTLEFLPKSAIEMRESQEFGDVPITIIYSATRKPEEGESLADVDKWHALTMDRMRGILRGTTHGRGPIVVPGTNHITLTTSLPALATITTETIRFVKVDRKSVSSAPF